MTLDLNTLSSLIGIVTSLVFSYFPGVKDWFETLEAGQKRLVMVGVAVVVVGALFGLSCAKLFNVLACTWDGVYDGLKLILSFMVANQATYVMFRKR